MLFFSYRDRWHYFKTFISFTLIQLLTNRWRPNHFIFFAAGWNRDGVPTASATDNKHINLVINPYAAVAGPQTISTPYGNYVRVDNSHTLSSLASLST